RVVHWQTLVPLAADLTAKPHRALGWVVAHSGPTITIQEARPHRLEAQDAALSRLRSPVRIRLGAPAIELAFRPSRPHGPADSVLRGGRRSGCVRDRWSWTGPDLRHGLAGAPRALVAAGTLSHLLREPGAQPDRRSLRQARHRPVRSGPTRLLGRGRGT